MVLQAANFKRVPSVGGRAQEDALDLDDNQFQKAEKKN